MTPAARYQAAIEVLDTILAGQTPEPALRAWGRSARFAGSKDRAAISDHVYDVLRNRGRAAALAGCTVPQATGRALILGLLRLQGVAVEDVFGQMPYGPSALSADEAKEHPTPDILSDTPDWLLALLKAEFRPDLEGLLAAMSTRAPVYLRVNTRKTTPEHVIADLAQAGVHAIADPRLATSLEVQTGARKITATAAYQAGLIEVQDLSVQMAMAEIPVPQTGRILDYCAGAGGKSLAIAARSDADLTLHDKFPKRMGDVALRAERAGMVYQTREDAQLDHEVPFDVVLLDVPCSGSGTWRRDPMVRWRMTPETLAALQSEQSQILDRAVALAAPRGLIIYMTCSLLRAENEDAVHAFLARHPQFDLLQSRRFDPRDASDGFFFAVLQAK